jgi:hypothetical protein
MPHHPNAAAAFLDTNIRSHERANTCGPLREVQVETKQQQQQQQQDAGVWSEGGMPVSPDAERFTGLKRTKIYELMNDGSVAWSKVGARRVVSRRSLRLLLEAGSSAATAGAVNTRAA